MNVMWMKTIYKIGTPVTKWNLRTVVLTFGSLVSAFIDKRARLLQSRVFFLFLGQTRSDER